MIFPIQTFKPTFCCNFAASHASAKGQKPQPSTELLLPLLLLLFHQPIICLCFFPWSQWPARCPMEKLPIGFSSGNQTGGRNFETCWNMKQPHGNFDPGAGPELETAPRQPSNASLWLPSSCGLLRHPGGWWWDLPALPYLGPAETGIQLQVFRWSEYHGRFGCQSPDISRHSSYKQLLFLSTMDTASRHMKAFNSHRFVDRACKNGNAFQAPRSNHNLVEASRPNQRRTSLPCKLLKPQFLLVEALHRLFEGTSEEAEQLVQGILERCQALVFLAEVKCLALSSHPRTTHLYIGRPQSCDIHFQISFHQLPQGFSIRFIPKRGLWNDLAEALYHCSHRSLKEGSKFTNAEMSGLTRS